MTASSRYPKTSIRLTSEDKAIIASLRARLGLRTTTDVIRLALRELDARGISQRRKTVETHVIECESCAATGEHGVPATTHSTNPDWSGYNLCQECANEYNSRAPINAATA